MIYAVRIIIILFPKLLYLFTFSDKLTLSSIILAIKIISRERESEREWERERAPAKHMATGTAS